MRMILACFRSSLGPVFLVTLIAVTSGKPDVTLSSELRFPESEEFLNTQLRELILDDIRNWNATCDKRDSCKIDKDNKRSDITNWDDRNCMCDDACATFGDCCPDAKNFRLETQQNADKLFTCKSYRQYNDILVISQCPKDWQDPHVRSLCITSNMTDSISMTPVTSKKTGFTYSNAYCAICNGESNNGDNQPLNFWKLRLECPDMLIGNKEVKKLSNETAKQRVMWNPDLNKWGIKLNVNDGRGEVFRECFFSAYMPEELQLYARPCITAISTCLPDWNDLDVHSKCSSYTSVLYGGTEAFRNVHCAVCNRIPLDSLQCFKQVEGRVRTTLNFNFGAFAVLFDIFDGNGGRVVGQHTTCKEGELYDLFSNGCRQVFCSKGQEYLDGVCQNSSRKPDDKIIFPDEDDYGDVNSNKSEVFANCAKFLLSKTEVEILSNGTLLVVPHNKYYSVEEYKRESDGTVIICAEGSSAIAKFDSALGWISLVGMGVSVVCLLLHLLAYILTPELHTFSGHLLSSLSVALFAAYGTFIAAQFVSSNSTSCFALAVCVYYFFLVAFMWSSVLAWDVWSTLRIVTTKLRSPSGSQRVKIILYSIYAWIVPGIAVIGTVLIDTLDTGSSLTIPVDLHPQFGKYACWFGQRKALLVYFAAPLESSSY